MMTREPKPEPSACKFCRFGEFSIGIYSGAPTCARTRIRIPDPVYGRRTVREAKTCESERARDRGWFDGSLHCGPSGRYFEEAPKPVPPREGQRITKATGEPS